MTNIRIFFSKKGRAKYISHLDMYRCFQRAVARAEIPIWYTQGFNPHVYMTFPLPLSLGYESERECVDMRLTEDIKFSEVRRRLNVCFPEGIELLHVSEQTQDQKEITFADYKIKIYFTEDASSKKDEFLKFWSKDSIIVEKLTKKKRVKEIDIKALCTLLECSTDENCLVLKLRCATGIETNLNPAMVIDTFLGEGHEIYSTTLRTAVYNNNLEIFK